MHHQRRKTVCMLVYNYHPSITGGAETQCRLQSHELFRQGMRCLIITAKTQPYLSYKENDFGCEIIRIPVVQPVVDTVVALNKRLWLFRSSRAKISTSSITRKTKAGEQAGFKAKAVQWLNTLFFLVGASFYIFINRKSIDVIHTHVASWNAGFAGWIGNKLNIPVVCKAAYIPAFHYFDKSIPFSTLWQSWRKRISYIALLPEMADDIYTHGVSENRVHIVPNGVCVPSDYAPVAINKDVLYVGNFSQGAAHKGFDVLISAWGKVYDKLPGNRLIIAGAGEKTPWKEMAHRLGCQDRISFLGHVSDLSTYYKQASIFVLPSRGEGISNALLEAQSYGIPAIVSDIPGNRAVVLDKKTGSLVSVNDYVALADEIIKFAEDPELREVMGVAARENIITNFSITTIVERLTIIYSLIADDSMEK